MADKKLLTQAGLKKLEDELNDLKIVQRKEIAEKIKEAREQGDLSENAEYDAAKEEQRHIEARIAEPEAVLKNAQVVEDIDYTTVHLGSRVTVYDHDADEDVTFYMVGSTEASSLSGRISNESPIGRALMGHHEGEVVEAEVPVGVLRFTIKKIVHLD